jgi:hypothetical protein
MGDSIPAGTATTDASMGAGTGGGGGDDEGMVDSGTLGAAFFVGNSSRSASVMTSPVTRMAGSTSSSAVHAEEWATTAVAAQQTTTPLSDSGNTARHAGKSHMSLESEAGVRAKRRDSRPDNDTRKRQDAGKAEATEHADAYVTDLE